MKNKYVFVSDSKVYGGHEAMSIEIAKSIMSLGFEVAFLVFSGNKRFIDALNDRGVDSVLSHDLPHSALDGVFSFLRFFKLLKVCWCLRKLKSDGFSAFVVQGDMEISSRFLIASKLIGMCSISYLPYAHSAKRMGRPLALLRDIFLRILYRFPDRFVVISPSVKNELVSAYGVANDVVFVVENFVQYNKDGADAPCFYEFRHNRDYTREPCNLLTIGRFFLRQKGQDTLLKAIAGLPVELKRCVFLNLMGEGDDEVEIKSLIKELDLSDNVSVCAWRQNPFEFFDKIDALVIPSNFEGVPLVMIESALRKIPILSLNRDGMSDYLHPSSLAKEASCHDPVVALRQLIVSFMQTGDVEMTEYNYKAMQHFYSKDRFVDQVSCIL